MEVANVISHHTPAMRALRRVAGSSDRPPAPFERSGEDKGIPALLSVRRMRTANSATRERGRAESWTVGTDPARFRDGARDDHNAGVAAYGHLMVRRRTDGWSLTPWLAERRRPGRVDVLHHAAEFTQQIVFSAYADRRHLLHGRARNPLGAGDLRGRSGVALDLGSVGLELLLLELGGPLHRLLDLGAHVRDGHHHQAGRAAVEVLTEVLEVVPAHPR